MDGIRVYREDGGSHPQKFEFVREDGLNTAWCLMDNDIAPKLPNLEQYIQDTEEGHSIIKVYRENTLEELANSMNLDTETVINEAEKYNEECKNGDPEFGKSEEFLKPIENGSYYAALMYDATRGVYGGIKTNPKAEVVNENDEPIPGLYTSGVISSGQFFGDFYPGRQALGVASHMGFIAGRSAVEYSK